MTKRVKQFIFAAAIIVAAVTGVAPVGAQPASPPLPDANGVSILIRTTALALNHANRTGNYTVFRDLGSPAFQSNNTAARLGEIFANLRAKNLDLSPVVLAELKLRRPPAIDQNGRLRLTGFFATKPLQVNFDLLYDLIDGRWRLFGISIGTSTAEAEAQAAPPPPQQQKKQ